MEENGLRGRQRRLLYILSSKHEVITGEELAISLGVSERTIRNDIAQINQSLETFHIQIEAIRGRGYLLYIEDRSIFHKLFSGQQNIQTKEDRVKYLIIKLIQSNEWMDLREIEDNMFVSKTTLENDVKSMRHLIMENQPYLTILRKGNYIKLEDNEIKKRNILIRLYCENWDYDSKDGILLKEHIISKELLDEVREITKGVLNKHEIYLDDYGYIYLILAFAVSYSRILEGAGLLGEKETIKEIELVERSKPSRFDCQDAVIELWQILKGVWDIEISDQEYLWMTSLMSQLIVLSFQSDLKEVVKEHVEQQCICFVETLLKELNQSYQLDFTSDDRFYINMLLHVQALKNGMISVQLQSQHLVEELRISYPFLGDAAHYLCKRLEQLCNIKLGREEENYLLPLLIIAQKVMVNNKIGKPYQAVIVSHVNTSLTYYFMEKLKEQYGSRLKLFGPYPIYDRDMIDSIYPDIIITTVKMDVFGEYHIPVVTISPLLEESDRKRINETIEKLQEDFLYPSVSKNYKEEFLDLHDKKNLKSILNEVEDYYITAIKKQTLFLYKVTKDSSTKLCKVSCKHKITYSYYRNIDHLVIMSINQQDLKYLGSFYRMAVDGTL